MVAQCYDGAAAMSSDRIGVAAYLKKYASNAEYFHCANHALNLATSQVTSVDIVRNAQSTMEIIITFVTNSAKREELLRFTGKQNVDSTVKHKLVKLCQTRFVERRDAAEIFWEQLPAIAIALEIMATWRDKRASSNATLQLNSLLKTEFLVGVRTRVYVASHLRPLSLALQERGVDLTRALENVDAVTDALKEVREEVQKEFGTVFSDVQHMAKKLGSDVKPPRVTTVSRNRANALPTEHKKLFQGQCFHSSIRCSHPGPSLSFLCATSCILYAWFSSARSCTKSIL